MTTSTNIKINIVEPGNLTPTPTPVDPSATGTTDISVPDTGLFTHGIGAPEATIISAIILLAVAAIVVAVLYNKHKKQGKVTKLVHAVDQCKAIFSSRKRITASLSALALLASVGTLAILLANSNKTNTNAMEGGTELTVDVNSEDLTIEVGDTPVFAYLPVELTVEEATTSGYVLSAYAEDTNLVSTTDESNIIPMVAINEEDLSEYTSLTDNTYGLSLTKPETKDDNIYTALSMDQDNPTILKSIDDYSETNANDKTTIYYGFYITPDTPKGTYEGSVINYEAKENEVATVIFDGNGKYYFGNDVSKTTNAMKYMPDAVLPETVAYSHTPNISNNGGQGGAYPLNSAQTFVYRFDGADKVYVDFEKVGADGECGSDGNDYFTFWSGFHPDYTAASYETTNPILAFGNTTGKYVFGNYSRRDDLATDVDSSSLTIAYATSGSRGSWCGNPNHNYGYYAVVSATNADGENVNVIGNDLVSGEYMAPNTNTKSRFIGWSTNPDDTKAMYYNSADDIKYGLDLDLNDNVTLYAISEPAFTISYNGNGADITSNMDNVEQYTTDLESTDKQVDLLASNFKKEGYGFAGWSTDQDAASKINNTGDDKPTIYGPNQMITVDPSASTKLNLYAVWVPAETNVTMQTFNPNSEPYASRPNGTVIALEDERDNEVYAVAKLADGNYWMIENLRLNDEPELSATNTNNPNIPLTNNYTEGTTSNSLSATSNDWCTNSSEECYNQSKLNTNNVANTLTSVFSGQDFTNSIHEDLVGDIYSYGNYYNWYSATAGNGTYNKSSGTVSGDICPTGWILPIGKQTSANGSFSHLDTSMSGTEDYQSSTEASNKWRSFPNNFVYSGRWYGSSADGRGYDGIYWSSTADSTNYAYRLNFGSGDVNPGTSKVNKNIGYSVRCVAPAQ